MLKGVHGNDHVGKLLRRRYEETSILNTCADCFLPRCLKNVLTDINTNDPLGPSLSHLHCIITITTAEVDDNFSCNFGEKFLPPLGSRVSTYLRKRARYSNLAGRERSFLEFDIECL